jgi:hypothetical protein
MATPLESHDPTPAERDERISITGLTFEVAVERLLRTIPTEDDEKPQRG